jgi:hypothetical protein
MIWFFIILSFMMRKYLKWSAYPLTLGASLLLGLLSFSGMFALSPAVSLAIASFILSVLYEGEIYKKNIHQAMDKLLNKNLILEKIGKEAIEQLEPNIEHQFIKDYYSAKKSKKTKKSMEIWLGKLLLKNEANTPYQTKTLALFSNHTWKQRAENLNFRNQVLKGFSALTSVVMTLGTSYLLLDTLTILPWLTLAPTTLPFVIVPLSCIAGIAYGFLTYNSLASFLLDHSLDAWWQNFKHKSLKKPENFKDFLLIAGITFIFMLNLTLTLCTAGTWWTVMNQSRTLWSWLQNRGIQMIQWLTPLVMGLANLGFNTRNIVETIKAITPIEQQHHEHEHHHHEHTPKETNVQRFNPFRLLLKLTYMPLRILLFIGHLISIGVTGDQMPGIPAIMSALLGIISEGFEDAHYFFDLSALNEHHHHEEDDNNEQGHDHSDIPNQILQLVFSPIFLLAAYWHYTGQNKEYKQKTFLECFNLMRGKDNDDHVCHEHHQAPPSISKSWYLEESMMIIHEQIERLKNCSQNKTLAQEKLNVFETIERQLKNSENITINILNNPCIKKHRYGFFNTEPPESFTAAEELKDLLNQHHPISTL